MADNQKQDDESTLQNEKPDEEALNLPDNKEINKDGHTQLEKDDNVDKPATEIVAPETPKPKRSIFRPELIFIRPLRNKLGRKARPVAIVVILLVILAIGGITYSQLHMQPSSKTTSSSSFKLRTVAFKLVSTVPSNNATNVNTASDIVLNFSQPVNPNKLINNMFITPAVTGTYKQGTSADQAVFVPTNPFNKGTKVSVMLNGTYQSNQGSKLGAAVAYGFTTSIPSNGIEFQDQDGLIDQVTSLPSGQKETYNLQLGDDIGAGASVTLYKGDVNDLLSSLVYSNQTTDGATYLNFNDLSVSTSGLQSISTQSKITNNEAYVVQQPDGLYLAVATDSSGKEVGFVWIDFSNFGLLLRQDDQKAVFDAQLFSNSQDVQANVDFYNLSGAVTLIGQKTSSGLTTEDLPFSPSLDIAIATYGGETVVVPVNVLNSGGDIRVDQDLSTAQQVYGVTDKPSYQVGDSIKYAGYVRNDNDAQYTTPTSGEVNLYLATYKGGDPLATFTAPIDSNGMFSGSITALSSWVNSGDDFDQLQIFASAGGNHTNDIPVASFSITNQSSPTSEIKVNFSKSDYLSSDPITATITATNSSSQPLANTTVDVHIFSQDYYENDPAANLADFGNPGTELPNSPVVVKLDANGHATYTLSPSLLPNDGTSQTVTLQVNQPNNTAGVGVAGGDSAIVHQGDGVIDFGLTRNQIPQNDDLISQVYAKHLNGSAYVSSTIKYTLVNTANFATVYSGSIDTDTNGAATIDIPAAKLSAPSVRLEVSVVDENGNTINATSYYDVADPSNENYDTSGAGLLNLNITGSSSDVNVGDTISLTINSPSNIRAMVSYDRGRIYQPSMVNLQKGNNSFNFTVTSELAPSFTLTFGYFLNGVYHSEGVAFNVSNKAQAATVNITPTNQQVSANQPTSVKINTLDSNGSPLATNLIVDVVSANAYDLTSQVTPNIFNVLYNPRPIMTSSSSSLTPIGSGGGRCGGGGGDLPSFANVVGTTLDWQPELSTDSSGNATVNFTPTSGSWVVNVYAMSGSSQVGYQSTTIDAN